MPPNFALGFQDLKPLLLNRHKILENQIQTSR